MSDMDYYLLSALLSALGVLCFAVVNSKRYKLSHIPTVGYSTPLLSYVSAWRYWRDPRYVYDVIEEGYRKHPNKLFKVPTMTSWEVIVNGRAGVEEMSRAPVEVVSNSLAFAEFLQLDYTLGRGVTQHPYHVAVVRAAITRNIAGKFAEVCAEIKRGYAEGVGRLSKESGGEWVEVPVYDVTIQIVARILARLSVGAPLCENDEFRELCGRAVRTLVKGRDLRFFPRFMRPLASRLLINVQRDLRRMAELIEPVVRERLEQEALHAAADGGEWVGKPNDVLMWLMDEAARLGLERTPLDLATRIYFLSFASEDIAVALTNALRIIASRPDGVYLHPLRAEIVRVLAQDAGAWTKNGVGRMYMLDSFLREVQRCFDIQPLHVSRRTLQPFHFADGTRVPAGVTMYANSHGMYRDEERFEDAGRFVGFRYVMMAEGEGEAENGDGDEESKEEGLHPTGSFKQPLLAKPAPDYHAFGFGKHACPGRFSATYQLKTMLAHVLMAYDVRVENPHEGSHGNGNGDANGDGKRTEYNPNADLRLAGARVDEGEGEGSGSKSGVGVRTTLWFRERA